MILLDISFIVINLVIGFNIKNLFSIFNEYDRKVLNMILLDI